MPLRPHPVFALLLALAASPAPAATASLIADINPGLAEREREGFRPQQLTRVGSGRVVFVADDPGTGAELWASDGTPLGTEMLRDTCPGPCYGQIEMLGVAGGVAFFLAGEQDVDRGIWRTDGTRAGTFPLGLPISSFAPDVAHAAVGARLFLSFCQNRRCQLWVSDGTVAGTSMVREFNRISGAPYQLTAFGGRLWLVAYDDRGQPGLWRSDGTAAGTVEVRPGGVGLLTAAGSRLFFLASGQDGTQLWTSDGTAAGTRPVTRFAASGTFGPTRFLRPAGDSVDFFVDDPTGSADIWTSDGTPAGTRRVTDVGFARPFTFPFEFRATQFERIGNRRFLIATDGLTGIRLWQSDGTPAGTRPVPGMPQLDERIDLVRVRDSVLVAIGNGLWAADGAGSRKVSTLAGGAFFPVGPDQVMIPGTAGVWRSDGTAAGTRRLLSSYREDFPFEAVALAGGRALFSADDDGPYGMQLWASDGTAADTTLLSTGHNNGASSFPVLGAALGETLVFVACDGRQTSLWRTGGSGGTVPLASLFPSAVECFGSPEVGFAVADGLAYAVLDSSAPLRRTDGTAAGTRQLTSFPRGSRVSLRPPFAFRGELLFPVIDEDDGLSIWSSDGTPEGTVPRLHLPQLAFIDHLAVVGNEFFFVAGASPSTRELWRSDGTAAGTRRIAESVSFIDEPLEFTRAGDAVYFVVRYETEGRVLWSTDGTAAGTAPVPRPEDGYLGLGRHPQGLAELGGALLYLGGTDTNATRFGLFRTDGTAAGTAVLAPLGPLARDFQFPPRPTSSVARLGNRLLFAAAPEGPGVPAVGGELWATDGTADGTVLVKDIAPGGRSSYPRLLTVAGGRLFFVANDDVHGFELWQSDGTAAGTRMVQDIAPGGLSSAPGQLTAAGGRLYFTADDGVTGREVWSLPLDAGLPACQPSASTLCLNGGRFRAEATWRDFNGGTGAGMAVPLSADTGYFWFFDPANVEVVLKVLDGRGLNGHFWTFYGALSNVRYSLTVTDTQTGATRRYVNPSGRFASVGDTVAFGPQGATAGAFSLAPATPSAPPLLVRRLAPATTPADKAPCVPAPTRLCLNGGRFARGSLLARLHRPHRPGHRGAAHRRHRLLLVLRRRQRRGGRQGARRPAAQRQVLGVLRRALERRVHLDRHRHRDRREEDLHQSPRPLRERRRHRSVLRRATARSRGARSPAAASRWCPRRSW